MSEQSKGPRRGDWGCLAVVALAVGAFVIANAVRFFARPDAWQQVRECVGGLALCFGGFLVFIALIWVFSSGTNRFSTSVPREWRALCRTYAPSKAASRPVGVEEGPPSALAAEAEEVTIRVGGGWVEVATQEHGQPARRITFGNVSLRYIEGPMDGALAVDDRPRQSGRLRDADSLPRMTLIFECSSYWSGPPSPALQPAFELWLVAVDAAGAPDLAATRELYSFTQQAIEEDREAEAAAYGL